MEKKKYYFIYQTTNKINGKIYVGKHETYDLEDGYVGSGKLLWKAIEKYGIENFERKILLFCENSDELKAKEAEIVNEEFVLRKDTYNLKVGGDGGWDYVNVERKENPILLKELGQKTSIGLKSYYSNMTDKDREKRSLFWKTYWNNHDGTFLGKHHTEETKAKIRVKTSIAQTGSKNSNFNHHWWKDPSDKTKSLSIKEGDPVPEGWVKGHWNAECLRVKHIEFCKYCGAEKGKCKHPEICKRFQIFPTLATYFKFDLSKIGNESIFDEIEKCRLFISNLYIDKQMSLLQIANFVGYKSSPGHLCRILDFLKIPRRTHSEAQHLFLTKK